VNKDHADLFRASTLPHLLLRNHPRFLVFRSSNNLHLQQYPVHAVYDLLTRGSSTQSFPFGLKFSLKKLCNPDAAFACNRANVSADCRRTTFSLFRRSTSSIKERIFERCSAVCLVNDSRSSVLLGKSAMAPLFAVGVDIRVASTRSLRAALRVRGKEVGFPLVPFRNAGSVHVRKSRVLVKLARKMPAFSCSLKNPLTSTFKCLFKRRPLYLIHRGLAQPNERQ
jgi:hypothetical protein